MLKLEEQASVDFGLAGNDEQHLVEGWAVAERNFRWSLGDRSRLTMPAPSASGDYALLFSLAPFVLPGGSNAQRLSILVNGRPVRDGLFKTDTVMACRFAWDPRIGEKTLDIVLVHPDAARPSDFVSTADTRRLAFMFSNVKLFRVIEAAEPPAEDASPEPEPLIPGEDALPDDKLLLRFASLGDNCELGMVQHQMQAEPVDLFRYSSIAVHSLLKTLRAGLQGIDAPENIEIELRGPEHGPREFLFRQTDLVMESHTLVIEGQQPGHRVFVREQRRVSFLARMLLADLKAARRIMVVKRNNAMDLADVIPLFHLLREHGPNTLLWVEEAGDSQQPGTVEILREGLLKGYIERFAPYDQVLTCDAAVWLPMCRRAHALWQQMRSAEALVDQVPAEEIDS